MGDKVLWLDYPSSISEIVSKNDSFDSCKIRVMYTGKNRNSTSISKEAVEKALPTLVNCPIVCNYNVETDTIGGHDVSVVNTESGVKLVNLTDAIGVIPAGANYSWEEVDDGEETHEYLSVDGLLWKRTSAYEKIKADGFEGQSMEIKVNSGSQKDGVYEIEDFSFTALCVLGDGVTPCFESASIETFSMSGLKGKVEQMMKDFQNDSKDDNYSLKGGLQMEEENVVVKDTVEDKKFAEGDTEGTNEGTNEGENAGAESGSGEGTNAGSGGGTESGEGSGSGTESGEGGGSTGSGDSGEGGGSKDPTPTVDDNEEDDASGVPSGKKKTFSLTASQMYEQVERELKKATVYDAEWGRNVPKYWFVDYDAELGEVYAESREDYALYGFPFSMNGDNVIIDFACGKRKKVCYVDMDEGEQPGMSLFVMANKIASEMNNEISELSKYRENEEKAKKEYAINQKLEEFASLSGNEQFEELKKNCYDLSVEQVEEKCYAIRGRMVTMKFSTEENAKPLRMPVENSAKVDSDEPYGGAFIKYGVKR